MPYQNHPTLDPQATHCAALYEALDHLVTALDFQRRMPPGCPPGIRNLYDPQWAIDGARRVLQGDSARRAAYQDYLLHMELAALAYDFALYLEELCVREIAHPQHIVEAMDDVVRLTRQSQENAP
jgi:hypothetical protein